MRLVETVQRASGMKLEDEDGHVDALRLLPGLSPEEVDQVKATIPCPIPADVEKLISASRGFDNGPLESFEFAGLPSGFELEAFPSPLPIAHDGFGNYWVLDLTPESTTWGPIFYACHDPPVIVYQSDGLLHFIEEVLRLSNPPFESEVDTVHEQAASRVWRENPNTLAVGDCLNAADADLRVFAQSLDDSFLIVDLRNPQTGDGFSWGRFGPRTVIRRAGNLRLFAYQRRSLLRRLFG